MHFFHSFRMAYSLHCDDTYYVAKDKCTGADLGGRPCTPARPWCMPDIRLKIVDT